MQFERELVPYDDLPETDEPLVELEKQEENIQSQLWDDNSTITDLLLDNTNLFQFASSNSIENSTNLTESLKGKQCRYLLYYNVLLFFYLVCLKKCF